MQRTLVLYLKLMHIMTDFLKDEYVKIAIQNDVKLVIDSDAHHPVHFAYLTLGIGQARRGWAQKSDILNTLSIDELRRSLK